MNKINHNISFGNRKIPRYIYHFTNKNNYQSMLKDGFIKVSENDPYLKSKGIYAVELQNMLKQWGFNKAWGDSKWDEPLYISLLRKAASWVKSCINGNQEIVVLKIPTDKLDISKLKVRSQNKFFEHMYSGKKLQSIEPSLREHLLGFTSAQNARLYKNKKEAIEYIYQDIIPINIVEKLGNTIDVPFLRATTGAKQNEFAKILLNKIFEGTQEAKCLHLLKD